TDGGTTWRQLSPAAPDEVIQINLAIAPTDSRRIYAVIATARGTGIYRSDDAGETWAKATSNSRPAGRIGGGDLPRLAVHPTNPDIVFAASTVSWKSLDGGKTWTAFKGAPGGDDYQNLWINPHNPDIILFASDQGATVTVNDGKTWSSWYNQPTAQLYHVAADNDFPYRVYSGQQESGSVGIASRGNDGQITFREWHPVGVDEYGYVAPDPLDPDIIYGGRSVTRYDRRTGQRQSVGPNPVRSSDVRTVRTQPVLFSPVDPHILYYASNTLWKTADGGQNWQQISPDLTRKTWDVPPSVGKYREEASAQPSQRGVIYTIGPSYIDVNRIWIGTDDGLIHTTADGGGHWTEVTPPEIGPWAKVSIMDAGRFDERTAYAAINTLRLDDLRPHIFRTHDAGKTWTHITAGIPDGAPVNAVREDPKRRGLLFAGTEREVYVSFDDGDNWQSLRLNMPASSMRDLIIKDDDLVVATHGRGFWILDDITPLRQLTRSTLEAESVLFKPQTAYRVRWNMNTDTPLPPEEPAGENPSDGAVINYALKSEAAGLVRLEILDSRGRTIRSYSSSDPLEIPEASTTPVPIYWYRMPKGLGTSAGMHRFLWDMHYQPLSGGGGRGGLPIAAIAHNTAPVPNSIWAAPGEYTVKLTVNGRSYTQPLTLKMDPRVKTPAAYLAQQFELSKAMYDGVLWSQAALTELRGLREQVKKVREQAGPGEISQALDAFDKKAAELEGEGGGGFGRRRGGTAGSQNTLNGISGSLSQLMRLLQGADTAPTSAQTSAVAESRQTLAGLAAKWDTFKTKELSALNSRLKTANLPLIEIR
ncbi:MAG: glycoside hydrolase, partial [Candidatus Aminicenantes bacterium]|nr:glycoside hydrolase [Candidatus Aminicenantes bacterium]